MGMVHGRTSTGSVIPLKVAADGSLEVQTIVTDVSLGDVTIEKMFGGTPEHLNGTATDTPAEVALSATSRSVLVDNLSEDYPLYFSLDGGTTYKKLPAESSLNIFVDVDSVFVKCDAGETASYEILAVEAE